MERLRGRHALVTGASRGIGAAIAERLAAEGADVVITARTVDHHDHLAGSLNETLDRCRRHGTRVAAVAADLADPASRATIVPGATARPADGPPFRTGGVTTKIGVYGSTKAALNRITNAFAVELYGRGVRINTVEPRAAVLSEGADALVGGTLRVDQIESMEAMVEATLSLCDCPPERTGGVHVSLDLLDELGITVMSLDGRSAHPSGQRGL